MTSPPISCQQFHPQRNAHCCLKSFKPLIPFCSHVCIPELECPCQSAPLSAPFPCWRVCCLSSQSQLKNPTSPVKCLPPLPQGKAGFTPQGLCGTCFCYCAPLAVFSPSSPLNYKHLPHRTSVLLLSEEPTHPNAKDLAFRRMQTSFAHSPTLDLGEEGSHL